MSNDKFDTARQVLRQQKLTGERALFQSENLAVYDSVFENGESPLKESSSLYLDNCLFRWKYPLWYSKNIAVKDGTYFGKRFHCRSTKKFPPLQGSNPDKCKFPECRGNPLELYRCKPVLCAGTRGLFCHEL